MNRIFLVTIALVLGTSAAFAQPRPIETAPKERAAFPAAPASFEAKYEGGMFGYTEKEAGTLMFDDANNRLVFQGKDRKEKFQIPYKSVLVIYPQSKSVTPTAGTVVSHLPLPGAGLAGLIKEKRRFLVLHFNDPDVEAAQGVLNFKLENKELLDSVLQALATKARLTQRGEAYYRPRSTRREL